VEDAARSCHTYLESYRSQIQGVPIETVVVEHLNKQGETDSVVINHRPLNAALDMAPIHHR
jgi:hypothetical protein